MATVVNIHEAKTTLSKLIAEVEAGGEVILARAGRPVARLCPVSSVTVSRLFGAMKGQARTTDAFFDPLPEDELAAWE